jgi:long-chain acyl-CoA synthetase
MDHPEFYPTTVSAIKDTQIENVIICGVKSYLPTIKGFLGGLLGKIPKADHYEPGHLFFDDLIKSNAPAQTAPTINPDEDLAMILYTSGTTGRPKGACLTHANLVFAVNCLHEWVHIEPQKGGPVAQIEFGGSHCFLGILPWYHIFGLWTTMLWSCKTGNKIVCIPDPRNGTPPFTEALQSIEKYQTTIVAAVPSIFTAMTNHPFIDNYDLSSIVACASGAAPLATETLARFEKKTGAIIFEGYGLSECLPIGINPTNLKDRKIGSVGIPCSNTTVKIVNIETGIDELPQGEDGEIAACGPQLMTEYLNRPDANQSDFRLIDGDRFFLTGDIGHIDEEGYLIITDRKKDMILVGGFNVYPAEVEEALISHPSVALAAVIGIPTADKKETVKAFVQLRPNQTATEEEILEHCKTNLSAYKCPKQIEFRSEIPTSIVGKVIRRILKEELQAKD